MNGKTLRIFVGWIELSDTEKAELAAAMREYNQSSQSGRLRILKESIERREKAINMPISHDACPCCGR